VIVWIALLELLGTIAFFHRFMNRAARPGRAAAAGDAADATEAAATDGGRLDRPPPGDEPGDVPVVRDRRPVGRQYHDANDAIEGLVAMGGLTVLAIVFSALLTAEYLPASADPVLRGLRLRAVHVAAGLDGVVRLVHAPSGRRTEGPLMGNDATDPRQTRAGTDTHLGDRDCATPAGERRRARRRPSIYRPFWKDARAELKRRDYERSSRRSAG